MKYLLYFTIFCLYFFIFPPFILCQDNVPTFEIAIRKFGGFNADVQGNFFYAFHYCKSIGKNVLTPNTKEKNDAYIKFATQNNIGKTWTSGNDLSQKGTFLWMTDGSPVTYTKWYPGNPDNYNQNERCIEFLLHEDGFYYWNDVSCNYIYTIVCESLKKQLPQAIKCVDL